MAYIPMQVPTDPAQLPGFLLQELENIARSFTAAAPYRLLQVLYAPPAKVAERMEVEADGTLWNPGSGAGRYVYRAGAWHFLG